MNLRRKTLIADLGYSLLLRRRVLTLSEDERKEFIIAIAKAKNELGSKVEELQSGFKAYATIEAMDVLNRQLEKL